MSCYVLHVSVYLPKGIHMMFVKFSRNSVLRKVLIHVRQPLLLHVYQEFQYHKKLMENNSGDIFCKLQMQNYITSAIIHEHVHVYII